MSAYLGRLLWRSRSSEVTRFHRLWLPVPVLTLLTNLPVLLQVVWAWSKDDFTSWGLVCPTGCGGGGRIYSKTCLSKTGYHAEFGFCRSNDMCVNWCYMGPALKVTEGHCKNDAIWSSTYDFLLVILSNWPVLYSFRDMQRYWLRIANYSYPVHI